MTDTEVQLPIREVRDNETFVTLATAPCDNDEYSLVILKPNDGKTEHTLEDLQVGIACDDHLEAIIDDCQYARECINDWIESEATEA